MWSRKYNKCIGCGTAVRKHWAKGYCTICYPKFIIRKTSNFNRKDKNFYQIFLKDIKAKISTTQKIRKQARQKVTQILTKELLENLYHKQNKSLQDIANTFQCSRVHIYNLCQRYNIKLKTKSKARESAYRAGKKLRYSPVNTQFFKQWSKEMAYALGFIYADGTISHKLDCVSISQKEIEILNKIKRLLRAGQNIVRYKHQDIYHLQIGSKKIVEDLLRLGVTPAKSLTVKFPEVPDEYLMHFIRGVFDGDGTATSGTIKIFTGSKDFAVGLRQSPITSLNVYHKRIQLHTDMRWKNPFYDVAICATDILRKLYHQFYEGVSKEEYLERKKKAFEQVLQKKQRYSNQKVGTCDKGTDN